MGKVIDIRKRVDLMSTTEISRRLGFNVSEKLLLAIGITPAVKLSPAIYWRREEYPEICIRLAMYVLVRRS